MYALKFQISVCILWHRSINVPDDLIWNRNALIPEGFRIKLTLFIRTWTGNLKDGSALFYNSQRYHLWVLKHYSLLLAPLLFPQVRQKEKGANVGNREHVNSLTWISDMFHTKTPYFATTTEATPARGSRYASWSATITGKAILNHKYRGKALSSCEDI